MASLSSASLGKRLSRVTCTALISTCVSAKSKASNALVARRNRALAARLSAASSCSHRRCQSSTALTASMGLSVSAATSGSFLRGLCGFGRREAKRVEQFLSVRAVTQKGKARLFEGGDDPGRLLLIVGWHRRASRERCFGGSRKGREPGTPRRLPRPRSICEHGV